AFAYPGLAPPVELEVERNRQCHREEHCDAGLVAMAFVRFGPLAGWPEPNAPLRPGWLAGSNLYVLAARELYPDPAPVPKRALPRAATGLTAAIQALARAHIQQIYTLCALSGMRFHLLAVPQDYQGSPVTFRKLCQKDAPDLFALGEKIGASGPPW